MSASRRLRADERAEAFLQDLTALFAEAVRSPGSSAVLQHTLDAALRAVGGRRGFLALVDRSTGDLNIAHVAGEGWNPESRRLRLSLAQENRRGITGHVALTGAPYFTGDVDEDPHYLRYFPDVKSELAVPVTTSQRQTRGVINIDSPAPAAFDTTDCAHVVALAQAASTSLVMAGFRAREEALTQIGNDLATTLDLDTLVHKVVAVAAEALEYADCSVFLLDEASGKLVLRASRHALTDRMGEAAYAPGEGLTGWVVQNAKAVRVEEPHRDPRWVGRFAEMPEEEIGSFLAVPIVSRDVVLGVLRVVRRKSHQPWHSSRFTDTDERVLGTIASQLGAAVENALSWRKLLRTERMAAWGELSARSAHMIGNRTFALKGDLNELGYVLRALPPSEVRQELEGLAASMTRGIARLEEILRDFRDFVVATQVALVPTDISAVAREAVEETFPRRSSVTLRTGLADGLPPVRCDPAKLKRALGELVENAISFQPEGGELRVVTRMATDADRAAWRVPAGDYVVVEFADAGPGVSPDIKDRIFQPFFTSRVKGMGLGLSIVKGIVEAHHGRIREVGGPGEGARFTMLFPAAQAVNAVP